MTTEEKGEVTTRDLVAYALRAPSEVEIEQFISGLEPEQVRRVYVQAGAPQAFFASVKRYAKKVLTASMALGEVWIAPDGSVHVWANGRGDDWKCEDPEGLALALAKVTRGDSTPLLTQAEIDRALPKVRVPDHRVLTELSKRDPQLYETIADFRRKPETAADLRPQKGGK